MNPDRTVVAPVVPAPVHRAESGVHFAVERGLVGAESIRAAGDALSPPEFASFVATAFRNHQHLGNVLTHVSGGNWKRVEEALRAILDPHVDGRSLTPLARNIVELMCADRGVTGRILKPYYQGLLIGVLGETVARRVIDNVMCLFIDFETRARGTAPNPSADASKPEGKLQ
ncbi:MAG TPA: hypothetical protein VFJ18_07380 [Pararhizobium sp.]|nr:hypothetical protein [Pararhizobium sp.]